PTTSLFPYTTLFRSNHRAPDHRPHRHLRCRERACCTDGWTPRAAGYRRRLALGLLATRPLVGRDGICGVPAPGLVSRAFLPYLRSEEHTSELQSLRH